MRDMCQPYINEINNVELFTSKLKHFIEDVSSLMPQIIFFLISLQIV